ncbi:MAG: glycosyltransferase family 2 protein [Muribaculaceae bacterium]|nr:glycosyltransferase family 2 protein [Muribaculaceae bacterium]
MASKAQITIIIPVYNRGEIVKRTLDSVANQSLRPLDVILVDNNSTDNTLETLMEWKKKVETDDFHVHVLSENSPGAAIARNRGLKEVTTPYTMFFDSDDIMAPNHAKRAIDAFAKNPELDVVGWDIDVETLNGDTTQYRFCDKDALYNHIFHATFATQRFAARTELFRNVGGWNEQLLGWDDYEYGVRILLNNPKIKKLTGAPTVKAILQSQSITGTCFSSRPHEWETALNIIDQTLIANHRQDMLKYIDVRRAILAGFYQREGDNKNAKRLLSEVLSRSGWYRKLIMKLFYNIIRKGGRGIALLARPLLCISK